VFFFFYTEVEYLITTRPTLALMYGVKVFIWICLGS